MTNGIILYEGPSKLDGAPIVVIAVGLKTKSTNSKTGAMVQTYILRSDMPPADAIRIGADASICGDCTHRGDGTGKQRSCYVTIMHGPRGVYAAYKRGSYTKVDAFEAQALFADRMIRLGTYGDPTAAPFAMWTVALKRAKGWTGYTHQFKRVSSAWSQLVMASADTEQQMYDAHALGYRTFRVSPVGGKPLAGLEVMCPASEEAGRKTECLSCQACMGTSGKARVSIQIPAHGTGKRYVNSSATA
ncbi:MAG: hypothetical protein ABW128_16870 [Rhizorhabdus sp.]